MDLTTALLAAATLAALYVAWNIGANDVANAMGTSVGSGALTLGQAIVIAAAFELAGALLVGGRVSETLSSEVVDLSALAGAPRQLALGMTCALVAAGAWLHLATAKGWPVSTTHSVVGGIVGFGLASGGLGAVRWDTMLVIGASWALSPLVGGVVAYALFVVLRRRVLGVDRPLVALRVLGPVLVFPVFALLGLAVMLHGLAPLRLEDLDARVAVPAACAIGLAVALASIPLFARLTRGAATAGTKESDRAVERVFLVLQIVTACFIAFAHGSNDVANAVGPLAAVYRAVSLGISTTPGIPTNLLLIGAVGIVVGLATYGSNVIATIGREITHLTPSRGFTAELATASTILVASQVGLPVSTTHTLVGAIVGVGFARSLGAVDGRVLRGIVASWLLTVPAAAGLAAALYLLCAPLF